MFPSRYDLSLINHCRPMPKKPQLLYFLVCQKQGGKFEHPSRLSQFSIPPPESPAICNLRVNQHRIIWPAVVFLLFASPTNRKGLKRGLGQIETFEKLLVTESSLFLGLMNRRRPERERRTPHGAFVCAPGPQVTCAFCYYAARASECVHAAFVNGRVTQSGEDTACRAAERERGPRIKRHIHLCV